MWSIMGVPGGLLLLLIFTGCTSGTFVTSCDSCHDEGICLKSRERGDSLGIHELSCVCKDGFVGDGLTCYDTKICSDSSCCSKGYHWSPDSGCVDTDECSLPDSPCTPSQICQNTPGSFTCLEPSFNARSGISSQSARFSCGNTVCPSGMDCLPVNGTLRCADPCEHYTAVDDDWRSTNNTSTNVIHCDQHIEWRGWYRMFLEGRSTRIPDWCVNMSRCGTHAPLWITQPHPTQSDEIESRAVCGHWSNDCCVIKSQAIHVKLCPGNFYIYKLVKPNGCSFVYCADATKLGPAVSSTTLSPTPQTSASGIKPSQFICGRDKIQVGLDSAHLTSSGLDPLSGNLAAINCSSSRVHDGVVWYEVEAKEGACGNTLMTNSTHAIYSNSLFIYSLNNASLVPPVSLPFSCAYPLDTETSLNVAVRPSLELTGGISGSGVKARASMSLFRNPSYTETYPAGRVTLPVGSPLYVGVSVEERDPGFALVLEDCYTTHSSNPEDPMRYFLIQNKCPSDRRLVSVTESGSSLQGRFSALLFLLQDEYRDIYLHCSLSLCNQRNSSCIPPCTRRRRRSVSTSEAGPPLTIGPIVWEKSPE